MAYSIGLALAAALLTTLETGAIPRGQDKGELELVVRGCLKGRELTAVDISGAEDLASPSGAVFRLSAKGDVETAVQQHNGQLVAVTGLVKKTALAEPGLRIGGARIVVGGGQMNTDPTRDPTRNPQRRVYPMQATTVSLVAERCPPIRQ